MRAYDAMQSKDGMLRDVSSALAITSQERLYLIQVRKHSNGLPRSRGCCDTHRVPNEALRRPGAQRRVTRSALLRCRIHWSRQRMRRCQKAGMNRRVFILVSQALSVWFVSSIPSCSPAAFRTCALSWRTRISADYLWQHSDAPRGAVPNHMLSSICIEHRPIFRRALTRWLTLVLFSEQCFVGLVLEVGLSLRGHEHDLLAYIDGLTYSNSRGVEGIEIPMRHVEKSEPRISSLTVTMHSTKKVIA